MAITTNSFELPSEAIQVSYDKHPHCTWSAPTSHHRMCLIFCCRSSNKHSICFTVSSMRRFYSSNLSTHRRNRAGFLECSSKVF